MSAAKMLLMAPSGSAQGSNYVDDVFLTNLRTGTGATAKITTPFDPSTGALVVSKGRSGATDWSLADTVQGVMKDVTSTSSAAQVARSTGVQSFDADGVTIGALAKLNTSAATYVDYIFKKKARFLDIVTYTGQTAQLFVPHSLGVVPGLILSKCLNTTGAWCVWHTGDTSTPYANGKLSLDNTVAAGWLAGMYRDLGANAATFNAANVVGWDGATSTDSQAVGNTYISYVFANDPAPDGIIRCGQYIGNGLAVGPSIETIGWEPALILIKCLSAAGPWMLLDSIRELGFNAAEDNIFLNTLAAEVATEYVRPLSTGFQITSTSANVNTSGATYAYMVIRRSNKPPTSGLDVFQPLLLTGTGVAKTVTTNIQVDAILARRKDSSTDGDFSWWDRLRGSLYKALCTSTAAPLAVSGSVTGFDVNKGYSVGAAAPNTAAAFIHYLFKRASEFFDQVCYVGTSVLGTDFYHNLGVRPELAIVKRIDATNALGWVLTTLDRQTAMGSPVSLILNTSAAEVASGPCVNLISSNASTFKVNSNGAGVNGAGTYLAYLFATLSGISKVGTYTGNGTVQDIACGFTTGARFVLIKRTDAVGDWFVWDTARGIQAANDPHLSINTNVAEVTTDDSIDPLASGFTVNQNATTNVNVSAATYIFLAIA